MIEDAGSFIVLDSVDSTNNYAMAQIHAGTALHGTSYFAYQQLSGKGRRGKSWQTEKGKNIIMTIVLNTGFIPVYQQFQLNMGISVACCDFLSNYTNNVSIKWPNDLYWNDSKAGGLLIENVIRGDSWQWAVIGIGLNINQDSFPAALPNPVSLKQITGETYNVVDKAKELHRDVMNRFDDLKKNGIESIFTSYNKNLYKKDQQVRLKKDNMVFETKILGVDKLGSLLTKDVMEQSFDFNEVEWLL
jgi:BirA family biotin operon repressor/biotin-[acetyl-CoA-carboxylase] ligase